MKNKTEYNWFRMIPSAVFMILIFSIQSCSPDDAGRFEIILTKYDIEMVAIPGGWFEMGDKGGSENAGEENP